MTQFGSNDGARLLDIERRILLHVMAGRRGKEIAPLVGTSYDMVEKHIKTAREKLGGVSRMDAARIVAAADRSGWVQKMDVQKSDLPEHAAPRSDGASSHSDAGTQDQERGFPWPLVTAGRPDNDLTIRARWGWVLVLALGVALMVLGLVAVTGSLLEYLARWL